MNRKVEIVHDLEGHEIVFIDDAIFRGRRPVDWDFVEDYLKRFVGEAYIMTDSQDLVYIGTDLPDEYAHSEYTKILKGANAKAKANAIQGLPEMIEIASGKSFKQNFKKKHNQDAKFGWYRYDSRFALPVFDYEGNLDYYNVFRVVIVVRHSYDSKMYLYDIMNIKKEMSTLF